VFQTLRAETWKALERKLRLWRSIDKVSEERTDLDWQIFRYTCTIIFFMRFAKNCSFVFLLSPFSTYGLTAHVKDKQLYIGILDDYETVGTLLFKLRWDKKDTSEMG